MLITVHKASPASCIFFCIKSHLIYVYKRDYKKLTIWRALRPRCRKWWWRRLRATVCREWWLSAVWWGQNSAADRCCGVLAWCSPPVAEPAAVAASGGSRWQRAEKTLVVENNCMYLLNSNKKRGEKGTNRFPNPAGLFYFSVTTEAFWAFFIPCIFTSQIGLSIENLYCPRHLIFLYANLAYFHKFYEMEIRSKSDLN